MKAGEVFKKGDVICCRYEVHRELGKGGFGVVYLAYDRQAKGFVAIKTLQERFYTLAEAEDAATKGPLVRPAGPEFIRLLESEHAFFCEAQAWVRMGAHQNIVEAIGVLRLRGPVGKNRHGILMEVVPPDPYGRSTLAHYLVGRPLSLDRALCWAFQFCLAMEYACSHGIRAHRDIKPANIMITPQEVLKLTDFGLAVVAEFLPENSVNVKGQVPPVSVAVIRMGDKRIVGTPGYMAPEVAEGKGAGLQSDVYSFGLVLYQMVSGSVRPPFLGNWRGDLELFVRETYQNQMACKLRQKDTPLWPVIQKCVQSHPEQRYADFAEIHRDIDVICSQCGLGMQPAPVITKPSFERLVNRGRSILNLQGLGLAGSSRKEELAQEAIGYFEQALQLNPNGTAALLGKADCLEILCRYEEERACLERACQLAPGQAYFYDRLVGCMLRLRRYHDCISVCDQALVFASQPSIYTIYIKGIACQRLRRFPEAREAFRRFLATAGPEDNRRWGWEVQERLRKIEEITE